MGQRPEAVLTFSYGFVHSRRDSCSTEAFTGAAANGHLDVLVWLYQFYRDLGHPVDEMAVAAAHGQLRVVKAIQRWVSFLDCDMALNSAAANGHVDVVDYFLTNAYHGVQFSLGWS